MGGGIAAGWAIRQSGRHHTVVINPGYIKPVVINPVTVMKSSKNASSQSQARHTWGRS